MRCTVVTSAGPPRGPRPARRGSALDLERRGRLSARARDFRLFAFGCRAVVAALRSASDPSTFSATRRDARPAARAQRRCSGAARSHNGRLERCATLVSTCTAARSATTTCARPPTQFKARALGSRCRCTERARSMASPQPAQRCSPDRSASWPVMSGGGGASARAVVN